MGIAYAVLVVVGLITFETVASIDNAIINADILSAMGIWARRWFLTWGVIIAVFGIRGVLPWFIIWFSIPSLGPIGALTAIIFDDSIAVEAIETNAPFFLLAGGIFMIFLFLHWLMIEEKNCVVPGERTMSRLGSWFYVIVAVILFAICYVTAQIDTHLAAAVVGGSAIFFIVQGFRLFAGNKSVELETGTSKKSDLGKLMLLEVIDATFSIDGVIGAFAFTVCVLLILIGNGVGAIIMRELTIRNIDNIKKYAYLKNGAMYSICTLGLIMCGEGFNLRIPIWFAPLLTIGIVIIFFWLSLRKIKTDDFGACYVVRE
jgi:hypothetical protein